MEILSLKELDEYLNKQGKNIVSCDVDLSDEESLPDFFKNLIFEKNLIVNQNIDFNFLPKKIDGNLFVGTNHFYTVRGDPIKSFEGFPTIINGRLHLANNFSSFAGLENTYIKNEFSFSLKGVRSFLYLPHFFEKKQAYYKGVVTFGQEKKDDYYLDILKNEYDFLKDKKERVEYLIQYVCERDVSEILMDSF